MKTSSRMRVAIVTSDFPDQDGNGGCGGISSVVVGLARALMQVKPDLDLHVIRCPAGPGADSYQEGAPPYTVHHVGRRLSSLGTLLSGFFNKNRQEVHRLLDRIQPDVVHVQAHADLIDARRQPSILTIHGIVERDVRFRHPRTGRLRGWILKKQQRKPRSRYKHVITPVAYAIQALEGAVRGRCHLVRNTVDKSFFSVRRTESGPNILCACNHTALKNVHGLIRAVGLLNSQGVDCTLKLAGRCNRTAYFEHLQSLVSSLKIKDRVVFLGMVSREALLKEMQTARCLAVPSFQESSPAVIAEASAMGVPVVASTAGGCPELVTNELSGMIVDPNHPESIAEGLKPLLQDPDLADRMGELAKRRAEFYLPEHVAAQTLAVYETAISQWDA